MEFYWRRLMSLGCEPEIYPAYLNKKITLTNQITLCLLLIIIGYSLFAYIYYPEIVFVPVTGLLLILSTFALNYGGGIYFSRALVSVTPILVVGAFNAYLTPAGGLPITSLYLMELTFALIPFLLIDAREKGLLILTAGFCFLIFAGFDFSNAWLEKDLDESLLREGLYAQLTILFSGMLAFAYIYLLVHFTYGSEKKGEMLIAKISEDNARLEQSGKDLLESLKQQAISNAEEKKREWVREGLNGLSTLTRNDSELKKMASALTKYIVKYLKANQAGFYMVKNTHEECYIELTACYAYEREKFGQARIGIGQGLLGQAYLEKEMVFLTDIPQNYLNITSGLGKANPNCIAIIPMIHHEKVEGLLEIASFEVLEAHHREFLMQASLIIASFLSSTVSNETTRELLRESQLLTEQIRSGEEEMRQNMEELSAIQEELLRKEGDYLRRISELETSLMMKDKKGE